MINNLYLIYGLNDFLVDLEIKKIIKNTEPINIIKYDLNNDSIEKVIDDACTISLFDQNKTIIVKNSNCFTSLKNEIEQDYKKLELYLNNPNPNTILIFLSRAEKLDKRKKVGKLIKEKGTIIEVNPPKDLTKIIINLFKEYKIKKSDIDLLIERVGTNLGVLNQEIIKLKNYKEEDYNITTKDILAVSCQNKQPDIYTFIDYIINKNLKQALKLYNDLLIFNYEPTTIIILLSNKFRLMYQSKLLSTKGYSINQIASQLKGHPYSIKLALQKGWNYEKEILLNYLNKFAELDFQIKSGKIAPNLGLELFLLDL